MDGSRSPLLDILAHLEAELARGAHTLELVVLDPDRGAGHYAGEIVELGGATYIHRPWRVWLDLAERLGLRMDTPQPATPPLVRVRFTRLDPEARIGRAPAAGTKRTTGVVTDVPTEKYGSASPFARISKLEDPGFVLDIADALARVRPAPGARVLDLGVNAGDELVLLRAVCPALRDAMLVGVDHSASAIAAARERFAGDPLVELHVADVAELGALGLGRFDLVIAIGLLQSARLDDRALLRTIVQHHLAPEGAVIIGVPNCRYIDGEVEYGARVVNTSQPELGVLVKDVAFYRKYLQQHRRKVFVTGKHYVLVTGIPATPHA